jgi:DNA-binding NarL/FixJ family response regulator
MIRILLIEDLTVIRETLAVALAADGSMKLRCCSSIEEGIGLLNGSADGFDIVLLKHSAGQPSPDEFLALANRSGLENRVLIITPGLTNVEQRRLMGLGVAGIFGKQRSLAELLGAIRQVAAGQAWGEGQQANEIASHRLLSRQESRAGEFVLKGLANRQIAARMGVSESAIKALLQRAFLKLGVHTRGQLVRVLMESR